MIRAGLLTTCAALVPTPAAACAVCLTSAYGDRSFNGAFVVLMLMPFAVTGALGVVLLVMGGSVGRPLRDLVQKWRRQGGRAKPERQAARC